MTPEQLAAARERGKLSDTAMKVGERIARLNMNEKADGTRRERVMLTERTLVVLIAAGYDEGFDAQAEEIERRDARWKDALMAHDRPTLIGGTDVMVGKSPEEIIAQVHRDVREIEAAVVKAATDSLRARLAEVEAELAAAHEERLALGSKLQFANETIADLRWIRESDAQKLAESQAREARLASALEVLISTCRPVHSAEPPERMIPVQHSASDIRQGRAALAREFGSPQEDQ